MKIGIDLDEVLGDFMGGFLEFYNQNYRSQLQYDEISDYNIWEILAGDREGALRLMSEYYQSEQFKNITPIPGSQTAIKILKDSGHELFVVTARQEEIKEQTHDWIKYHFPDTFTSIHFAINSFSKIPQLTKGVICDSLGVSCFIDDSVTFTTQNIRPDRKVFLINRPWNKDYEVPSEINRVHNWDEILKKII